MKTVRPRRSVWFGVGVVVVFFTAVTLAIGWVGSGAPGIPHAAGGDCAACTACHPTDQLPDGHRGRAEGSCGSCHLEQPAATAAPEIRPVTAARDAGAAGRSGTLAP